MGVIKEISEDSGYLIEYLFGGASKEYEFNGTYGPIFAVNGALGGWTKKGLRKFMHEQGVEGILLRKDLIRYPIESYYETIKATVERYQNPTLLGFSAGGLLAMGAVDYYNLWERINKLITVGTPFNGINKRFLKILGPGIHDIQRNSPFIQRIAGIKPPKEKMLSIFAKEDKFIPHPEGLNLPWNTIIKDATSHGQVQNHLEWYLNELKEVLGIP